MDPIKLIESIVDDSKKELAELDHMELAWNCSRIMGWVADGGFIFPFNSRELASIVRFALTRVVQKMECE